MRHARETPKFFNVLLISPKLLDLENMVRVISVHHFANQFIQVIEQPTACTVAPPNRLLSALMSNCVEVRDLSNESEVLFTFPTVDEVIQIVHCLNGKF